MNLNTTQQSPFWVVIPAAGIGHRFGSGCPKQYALLSGQPLLKYTVDIFLQATWVKGIMLVLHAQDEFWPKLYERPHSRLMTTVGGEQRVDSVLQGLLALEGKANENDWVLVHDAARPCLRLQSLQHLIIECQHHSVGGLLGRPVTQTIKIVNEEGCVEKTQAREALWEAQTPQMFRYGLLRSALDSLTQEEISQITDEASAIERLGYQPHMVLGEASNLKVTYAEDLALAEWYLKQESAS